MWHQFLYQHVSPYVPLVLAKAFVPAYLTAGNPDDFAILIRKEADGKSSTIFFPPSTASLLALCPRATECEKPAPEGISVLHGERKALAVLFPEQ